MSATTAISGTASPPVAAGTDWAGLARRSKAAQRRRSFLLHAFLFVCSLPVIVPYVWLLTLAFSPRGAPVGTTILWRALVVVLPAIVVWLVMAASPRGNTRALGGLVVVVALALLAVLVGPLISLENWQFLFNPDVVAEIKRGVGDNDYPSIWLAAGNSLLLAGGEMVVVCTVATLAAYYLSRFEFYGRGTFLKGLMVLHAFPVYTLVIPIFLLMYWVGMLDTIVGVVLVIATLELPFAIYIMKGFFDAVPWEIEMSAMADGASRRQAFWLVVLPQVKVGIAAIAIFAFLRGWEEYVFVATLLLSKTNWVMSLFLFFFAQDTMGLDHGLVSAIAVFYLLPSLILYAFTQRYLTQVSFSGIKG